MCNKSEQVVSNKTCIQVPIITDVNEVDFIVGPSEDAMQKYLFEEGMIVELNNQAKHSVNNRMKDTWRVHLIFDYVEEYPITRYMLQVLYFSFYSDR